jgi:uncharacterized SAM-binding protein YcdF (DUF218 family)
LRYFIAVTQKRKWILRIAFALFTALLLLAVAAIAFPRQFLCVDSGPVKADMIIVLGGGPHEQRPERAAELFKERAAPRLIVSGAGDDEIHRQILIEAGVPAASIQVEGKSTTTRENAEFTIKLLREQKIHRAIIVTSWYHARRGLATFRHFAPEIEFYSRPSYFAITRKDWSRAMAKRVYLEYVKLPGYWIRYGVCPFSF